MSKYNLDSWGGTFWKVADYSKRFNRWHSGPLYWRWLLLRGHYMIMSLIFCKWRNYSLIHRLPICLLFILRKQERGMNCLFLMNWNPWMQARQFYKKDIYFQRKYISWKPGFLGYDVKKPIMGRGMKGEGRIGVTELPHNFPSLFCLHHAPTPYTLR